MTTVYTNDQAIENLLDAMHYLRIIHHVKGRIRIKASWDGITQMEGFSLEQVEAMLQRIPGLLNYRINLHALSIVINYDATILQPTLWEEIAAISNHPASRETVKNKLADLLEL